MIMLLIIGVFIGFNISKSNLKEMETSFTELRNKKKSETNQVKVYRAYIQTIAYNKLTYSNQIILEPKTNW